MSTPEARAAVVPVEQLRVLCISHSAVSRNAGRLRYAPLLGRTDLAIDVVAPARWHEGSRKTIADPPHPGDVPVHVLPIRLPKVGPATWHLHHYEGLGDVMRRLQPQVIHLWQEPWSLVTLQAVRLRNKLCPQTPIVLEVDQNILKRLPPPFEQIRRYVLRQTGFILARSVEALRVVEACGYTGPSALVGYGVDTTVFQPGLRQAGRAKFGFEGFTVGYVGRMVSEKGVDDLIDAAARTAAPVNLALMGDGPHLQALLQRAAAVGIADRVGVHPWGGPEDVAAFMGGLDLLALLTRTTRTVREQFGRVIIEAQACGTPVIGSTCGAIPDVVGDGGWIVPESDPAAVATVIDRLMMDRDELQAGCLNAQGKVTKRFSYGIVADTLAKAWWSAYRPDLPAGCTTADRDAVLRPTVAAL